jgi:hypothetical protein
MTLLQAAKSLRDAQRKYMTLRSGSKMASLEVQSSFNICGTSGFNPTRCG